MEHGAHETFEVEYGYYQYDSGAGDSGDYVRRVELVSMGRALALGARIKAAVAGILPDGEYQDLIGELIPWHGYFSWARGWRVGREPVEARAAP